jgi:hypothetical protein
MRSSSSSKSKPSSFLSRLLSKHMPKSRLDKAQFFVLTGFMIVSVFYLVSRWLEPYTIIDTSAVAVSEEPFIFNNIKQEALDIVAESGSCKDLVNNLEEYKHYVEDYAFRKLIVYFDYSLETPCYIADPNFPVLVLFDIELSSSTTRIKDSFFGFWPPGSAPS